MSSIVRRAVSTMVALGLACAPLTRASAEDAAGPTETLLALTMASCLDPNSTWCATPTDPDLDGSRVGLVPGQNYRIDDRWYAVFLRSGNDAADAIAKAGADGDPAKAVHMNTAFAVLRTTAGVGAVVLFAMGVGAGRARRRRLDVGP
jgi:D-alanyl-D-alanine carboxypeptidase